MVASHKGLNVTMFNMMHHYLEVPNDVNVSLLLFLILLDVDPCFLVFANFTVFRHGLV